MRRISHGRRRRLFVVAPLLVVLGGDANLLYLQAPIRPFGLPWAEGGQTGSAHTVKAATSTARQGAYYLPSEYESRSLPLMVSFHGTGGKGSLMILLLQALAEREGFIVLAPDSVSVAGVWSVALRPDDVTEDHRHVMDCVREVLRGLGVRVDPARVLAAGFSVGGNSHPPLRPARVSSLPSRSSTATSCRAPGVVFTRGSGSRPETAIASGPSST